MSQPVFIDRPPRIQPELPVETIEIPSPPQQGQSAMAQLIQMALPLVTILGFMFMMLLSGGRSSPLMVIPMVLMVISSAGISIYTYIKDKRDRAAAARAYTGRLVEMNRDMHNYHDQQRRFYSYNYPDRATVARIVRDARWEVEKGERTLRAESRLWERRTTDEDFGVVRLGMGTLPSTVLYVLKNADASDDPLTRAALKLQEDSRFVNDIPVIISFRPPKAEPAASDKDKQQEKEEQAKTEEERRTPAIHAVGVAGDRTSVYEFARAALGHYAVFHAPMDGRLYVMASRKREWAWAEQLPHSRGDESNRYTCFLDSSDEGKEEKAPGEEEETPLARYLEGLRRVLAQRKLQLQETNDEGGAKGDPTLPFMLVVVDLMDAIYDKDSPLSNLEGDAALSILLAEGALLGAAVLFLVPERSKVPSGCQSVIEVERTTPATNSRLANFQRLHFRYAEIGVNTYRYVGEADLVSTPGEMADLAQRLAELDVRQSFGASLPATVPFMDFMGYRSMQELDQDAWDHWQGSAGQGKADWLRAKIGVMSGNKLRTLVFSAKRDGVHGMVAGSTGSGKSELLISLITGMAVTYDPTTLNFVLVDYKGGGAFKGFDALPHCVDIITNLGSEGVTRMFTAINAELQRRQKLNADTNTKNIVDYRKQGLHVTRAPYPFLFIIIDEFAEMIADRAEYKTQLETITRVGRAQGVSLILAAQRPSGVTDQMRSNIKFRICLRVESTGESREMLRRGDAAFLPGGIPGRGYLQVGNEDVDLIQVAYTGDKYVDPARKPRSGVLWPGRGDTYDPAQDQEPPELYRAIVSSLATLANDHGVPAQTAPWPGFLPARFSLASPLVSQDPAVHALTSDRYLDAEAFDTILLGEPREPLESVNSSVPKWLNDGYGWVESLSWERHALRPVVGLVDNPYAARQMPLVVDFPRGHAVVFGASGWGKTTFIRTLAVSLAATHSPNHAHLYILDLGGRNLGVLEKLPHVGAVINPDEEGYQERVEQLLRELDTIVDKRKTILSNAGLGDIYQYNASHPNDPLPGIVVAIDNFTEFKETFGGGKEDVETVLDKFVTLARECKPYGVHLIVTVNQLNVLSTQLFNLFTERFTLKLGDATDYRAIVGAAAPDIADIPGRGYVSLDRLALSFQVALPVDLQRADRTDALHAAAAAGGEQINENSELERLATNMRAFIARAPKPYRTPVVIGALPKAVLLKQLLAREHGLALDEAFLPRLKEITRGRWAASVKSETADWLKVTLGLVSGDRPREMRLEARRDGVHGLIAGGTGSGKSELLMTLVVGLALNYDPSILNFVLVDYKGGGAFKPFEELPHCVDSISNLNKAAVRRMFTAINAEMLHRQKLNADTGTKDIVEYRQKGYHQTGAPYPHLFIIIDEYAEMISESPEFKEELDSITRVGRSAGVNLLLAAQRPIGVTDQMRANIKFRICLRVEETETSREMLRRSDAAFLPGGLPGRGYLQVGSEGIELMQTAYTGETYPYAEVREGGRAPKFYDVIVDMANDLLAEGQVARPCTPWPPFLPTALTMASPLAERYFEPAYRSLAPLGPAEPLALNPFLQDWLDGKGAWPDVDWTKQAMRAVAGLLDDPYNARQLPLLVDFNKGHAVMFGASGWGKTTFLRSLILSLAGTHSPDEFQAHVLDLGGRNLEVLRSLPQVGTVIMPDEPGYQERVQQLLRELNDVLDARKKLFAEAGVSTLPEYNSAGSGKVEPAILVAIDNFGEYIETFGGDDKANDASNLLEALVALMRQSKAYGIHFVITANRLNVLSGRLLSLFTERLTLRLAEADDYAGIVGARVPEVEEIAGRGFTRVDRQPLAFQIALPPGTQLSAGQIRGEAAQIRAIGAQMQLFVAATAATHKFREPLRIDALPKNSSYRQVLTEELGLSPDRAFLDELKAAMARTWARNATAEAADWLQATIGIKSGMKPRRLHLEAKRDGVHGMLAGGTGSGKSEALMTMIVGLALNYSPEILNFVLVDYKGGGAFKPFERLPHCVDSVTNLNKAAVNRMFTAINAEIRRRQQLNADTGTKDIIEYRRKGRHLTREPYPHLFIIIDEYAEMIDDNPEYKDELESITRVGRSQGVNLILASQRPKGVTDQMRANIKLKLCLRVEQTDTSQEMLRRSDAAFLPNGMPGRGYLQVGNEPLELIQVSYTGESQPDDREPPVTWPARPRPAQTFAGDDVPKLFDAVVMLAGELTGGQMARKPWPAFLPRPPHSISLQSAIFDAQAERSFVLNEAVTDWLNGETVDLWPGVNWESGAMRPAVGLVDDPAEARQTPLGFDLTRQHLAVFGDSGWGKTSFLRSLIVDLAATHSPDELHIHVLDLGGRNYRSLEALPQMGAVLYADEESFDERLQRLLDKLTRLADERSQTLAAAGVSNLYEYNARFPDQALPAVLVVIDNFAPLHENYELFIDAMVTPLVRRSLAAGISFVMAANGPNNLPSRLLALIGEQITFKQSNPDRYMDIVGRGAIEIDDIPGRGYIRISRRPMLFQAALPVGALPGADGRDTRLEADELRLLAGNMAAEMAAGRRAWRSKPDHIDILPEIVPLKSMLERSPAVRTNRVEAVLGQSGDLQPAVFDLKRTGLHFLVVGPPVSGKTTTLVNFVLSLAYRYTPEQVLLVLVDPQRRFVEYGGRRRLDDLPHVVATVNELDELVSMARALKAEAQALATRVPVREIFVLIDNYDDIAEEIDRHSELVQDLATVARRYGRDGAHFVLAGALDSGISEFRRAVQATYFGVGLRTPGSLDALRVMRIPASFRSGKDLAIGRGYAVKSGLPTMIQVASPYDGLNLPPGSGSEEEDQLPQALDWWIEMLLDRHPGPRATWSAAPAEGNGQTPAAAGDAPAPEQGEKALETMARVQRALQWEAKRLQDSPGATPIVAPALGALDAASWSDTASLMPLFKQVWWQGQREMGLTDDSIDSMAGVMDDTSILMAVDEMFPPPGGSSRADEVG